MDVRKKKEVGIEKFINPETAFIVKCKKVLSNHESNLSYKNIDDLFVFKDLDSAIVYMNIIHDTTINQLIIKNDYKIMFSVCSDDMLPEDEDSNIVFKRCTKLIGNKDSNISETIFFTFTVSKIKFKNYL